MKVIRVDHFSQVLGHSEIGWIVEDAHENLIVTPECKLVHVPLNTVYFLTKRGKVMSKHRDQMGMTPIGELSEIRKFSDIRERARRHKEVNTLPDIVLGAN